MVEGRYKFILDLDTQQGLLFDLANDPSERVDRSRELPERAARMRARLGEWGAKNRPAHARVLDLTDEEKRRLRQLGYL